MNVSNNLNSIYTGLLKSSGNKIDSAGFNEIKKEILSDGKVTKAEHDFIVDVISNEELKKGVAKEAISFLEENPVKDETSSKVVTETKTELTTTATTKTEESKPEPATTEAKPDEVPVDKDGYPIDWKSDRTLSGGFNFASGTNGGETRGNLTYAGSFQKSHNKIDFNIFGDYGKSTTIDSTTGEKQTNVSGNAFNFDTTYSYLMKKEDNAFNYAPYVKFETKGKITDMQDRSYRESSGLEIIYVNESKQSDYNLKFGFATEQKFDATSSQWDRETGGELVFTGKQGLGFVSPEIKWLSRVELSGTVNATRLTSLDGHSGTNGTAYLGARYYVTDDKNTFVEAGKKYELTAGVNGEPNKINSALMFNLGFKY